VLISIPKLYVAFNVLLIGGLIVLLVQIVRLSHFAIKALQIYINKNIK